MKYPEGTTHFGHRLDGSIIWYCKTNEGKYQYITNEKFTEGNNTWSECIAKPTIPLMRIHE